MAKRKYEIMMSWKPREQFFFQKEKKTNSIKPVEKLLRIRK